MSSDGLAPRGRLRAPFDGRRLARLARGAGAIALEHAGTDGAARAPSAAVSAVESWIAAQAREATPAVRVTLARETGRLPRAEWILSVDALDGADAYVAGLPTWSVCVGLLHWGEPWAAAVYAPALNDLYVASSGGLRWQGRVLRPEQSSSGFVLGTGLEKRSILRLRRRREVEGPISYHVCLVARGAAEGAVLGTLAIRQAAPLAALLRPVGAEMVELRTGRTLELERLARGLPSRGPILAAAAGRTRELVRRLNK